MQQTVNQRFKKLAEVYTYGNISRFAQEIEAPVATITSIVNGQSKSITDKTLRLIAETFPEIDLNWLITGNGDMYRQNITFEGNRRIGSRNTNAFQESHGNYVGSDYQLKEDNLKLRERILELERENWELKKRLEQSE